MTLKHNPIRRVLLVLTKDNRRIVDMQGTELKLLQVDESQWIKFCRYFFQ